MSVDGMKSFREREASAEVCLHISVILTPGSGLQLWYLGLALSPVSKLAATRFNGISWCTELVLQ